MATFQQDLQAVENRVVQFLATIKHDVEIAEQDIITTFQFLQAHSGTIAAGITGVLTAVAAAGIGIPAPVLLAAQGVNAAAQAINAAVAAQQASAASGGSTGAQTVALLSTAYQNLKSAQSGLAQGQATVAQGGTTPPAS